MHGLEACLFKYITVAAFSIYALRGEDAAKRGGWRLCLKYSWKLHRLIKENRVKIMEKCF